MENRSYRKQDIRYYESDSSSSSAFTGFDIGGRDRVPSPPPPIRPNADDLPVEELNWAEMRDRIHRGHEERIAYWNPQPSDPPLRRPMRAPGCLANYIDVEQVDFPERLVHSGAGLRDVGFRRKGEDGCGSETERERDDEEERRLIAEDRERIQQRKRDRRRRYKESCRARGKKLKSKKKTEETAPVAVEPSSESDALESEDWEKDMEAESPLPELKKDLAASHEAFMQEIQDTYGEQELAGELANFEIGRSEERAPNTGNLTETKTVPDVVEVAVAAANLFPALNEPMTSGLFPALNEPGLAVPELDGEAMDEAPPAVPESDGPGNTIAATATIETAAVPMSDGPVAFQEAVLESDGQMEVGPAVFEIVALDGNPVEVAPVGAATVVVDLAVETSVPSSNGTVEVTTAVPELGGMVVDAVDYTNVTPLEEEEDSLEIDEIPLPEEIMDLDLPTNLPAPGLIPKPFPKEQPIIRELPTWLALPAPPPPPPLPSLPASPRPLVTSTPITTAPASPSTTPAPTPVPTPVPTPTPTPTATPPGSPRPSPSPSPPPCPPAPPPAPAGPCPGSC